MRTVVAALVAAVATLGLVMSTSCAVRDRITGDSASPTATRTPRPTSTSTATSTPTPLPTPTATPTPILPPNAAGLARWERFPVTYCIATGPTGYVTPEEFVAAVDRAFAAWGVPSTDDGSCGPLNPDDGVNEVGWGDLSADAEPGRLYEAGLTKTTTSECSSGCDPDQRIHLTEADITIDAAPPPRFRDARCLYGTLLHEVGHFLGLDHLGPGSIMAAETNGCPTELTAEDRRALIERYGALAGG